MRHHTMDIRAQHYSEHVDIISFWYILGSYTNTTEISIKNIAKSIMRAYQIANECKKINFYCKVLLTVLIKCSLKKKKNKNNSNEYSIN